jgi:predicted transcriptional regulator
MSYSAANYDQQGGAVRVQGGQLRVVSGGKITADGTQAADFGALTDNTGGTPSTTLAAITAGASYAQADLTAIKNALASMAADINALRACVRGIGAMA